MTNEEIRDKIARHFGLGEYGVRLAQEYLDEYAHNLAEEVRAQVWRYYGDGPDYDTPRSYGLSQAGDLIDPYLTD